MYADRVTESMRWRSTRRTGAAPTRRRTTSSTASSRRRSSRASATSTTGCAPWPRRPARTPRSAAGEFSDADREEIEALVAQMEAEMKAAAKQLEFERAAALRDEIQQIRLRVLEEDASITVGRAAERRGARPRSGGAWPAPRTGRVGDARGAAASPRADDGGHQRRRPASRRGAGGQPGRRPRSPASTRDRRRLAARDPRPQTQTGNPTPSEPPPNSRNLVAFPRDRLVVITGLSGSGKSSLAFDTIYAEGQRRYVESLSAYARQFLGQMEKPDVDQIDGLSPAISIDQKGASRNPARRSARSPRSTTTCACCSRGSASRTAPTATRSSARPSSRSSTRSRAARGHAAPRPRPAHQGPQDRGRPRLRRRSRQGFVRVRVDGEMVDIADAPKLDKYKRHSIEVVVDRLLVRHAERPRARHARRRAPPTRTRAADPDPTRAAGRFGRDRAPARRGRG